jgi:hypothetical protein
MLNKNNINYKVVDRVELQLWYGVCIHTTLYEIVMLFYIKERGRPNDRWAPLLRHKITQEIKPFEMVKVFFSNFKNKDVYVIQYWSSRGSFKISD